MKEAYWGYWLIVLGVFIIVVLLLVQNFTSTNSQDFYLVKEITEAAMEDAIDWGYYREYGEAKINKEKFYESFIRRFAEEASISATYDIEFTEVYEAPPKVGVKVSSKSNTFSIVGDAESFDIVNRIDAILESTTKDLGTTTTKILGKKSGQSVYTMMDYLSEDGSKSNLASCKIDFDSDDDCKSNGEVAINILTCGKPTAQGVFFDLDADTSYCIAYRPDNDSCTVTATYDEFKNIYCR